MSARPLNGRALLLALGLLLATPRLALAHASFIGASPADICAPLAQPRLAAGDPRCRTGLTLSSAPSQIRLDFSEPVVSVGRGLRLIAPSGAQVPVQLTGQEPRAELAWNVGQLSAGTYTVVWQVQSADTHPVEGAYAFSVGQPSPSASGISQPAGHVTAVGLALQSLARWLHFAGFALGFGAMFWVLAGAVTLSQARAWINLGVLLLLAAEPLALFGQTASFGLDQTFDGGALFDTLSFNFGRWLALRLAAALLLWALSGEVHASRAGQRLAALTGVAIGLAMAGLDGFTAHAASIQPLRLGLALTGLHLEAMATAFAGVGLAASGKRPRIALAALLVLPASGIPLAAAHFTAAGQLIASGYGRTLMIKAAIIVLAGILLAGTRRARLNRPLGPGRWLPVSAMLTIAGITGLLVSLPPPR